MRRLVLGLVVVGGCAPSLSNLQPAHVAPRGHVSAEAGLDVSIPTGTISDVLTAGKTLVAAAGGGPLTDEQKSKLFDAGLAGVLNPPSAGTHFGIAYTPLDRFELSLRYTVSAWRGGARFQVLEQTSRRVDMTVGVGVAQYVFQIPMPSALSKVIRVDNFVRWQIDVPVLVGRRGDWDRVWAGPKLMVTTYSAALTLDLPPETPIGARVDGRAIYLGGQAGVAVGWKYAFLALELTLAELQSTTTLAATALGSRDVDISSFIVYPSLGLIFQF